MPGSHPPRRVTKAVIDKAMELGTVPVQLGHSDPVSEVSGHGTRSSLDQTPHSHSTPQNHVQGSPLESTPNTHSETIQEQSPSTWHSTPTQAHSQTVGLQPPPNIEHLCEQWHQGQGHMEGLDPLEEYARIPPHVLIGLCRRPGMAGGEKLKDQHVDELKGILQDKNNVNEPSWWKA